MVIGAVLIIAVIGYLFISAFRGAVVYYLTVSELYEKGAAIYDEPVRVSGKVVAGASNYDALNFKLTFALTDDAGMRHLPVIYNGAPPDMFHNATEIVVEGKYTPAGVFEAENLFLKCPSKYEMQEQPDAE